MTAAKPAQLAMPLADPGLPPMESYIAVMLEARKIREPEGLQVYLDRALMARRICRTDAQCIWRGLMRQWATPFD